MNITLSHSNNGQAQAHLEAGVRMDEMLRYLFKFEDIDSEDEGDDENNEERDTEDGCGR